jgi:hypothetical protein
MKVITATGLALVSLNSLVFSQSNAISDKGERIKLYENGTWEYANTEDKPTSGNSLYIGKRKLTAGERTVVHHEEFGLTTSISLAKDGNTTLIIFWQESTNKEMNFFNWLWSGKVILYLDDGETISLLDRNLKGQNKIIDGYVSRYGSKSDLYQRYSAHYLTKSECTILEKADLLQIGYQTNSAFERGTTYLRVTRNGDTLKKQLSALVR